MDNVLRRLRRQLGWTQDYLANLANITPLSVIKYEQGLYTSPSPTITHILSEHTGISQAQIIDAYRHDVEIHRKDTGSKVLDLFEELYTKSTPPVGNFTHFREVLGNGSLMGFCKILAVHPSVVSRYEKAPGTKMPTQLREALLQCGLAEWQVDFIDLRHAQSHSDAGRNRPALVS